MNSKKAKEPKRLFERKSFNELSDRQKRRRVENVCQEIFKEIDSYPFNNEENMVQESREEKFEQVMENVFTEILTDVTKQCQPQIDYIEVEYEKLFEDDHFYDSLSDNETSEEENACCHGVVKENDIRNKLSFLIITNNFPDIHANSLLRILRDAGLTFLPKDVRSLRITPRKTVITECSPGSYFHYGLEKAINDTLNKYDIGIKETIVIDLNIDGVPITKSPPSWFWPVLGKTVHDFFNEVFVIGVYHGCVKPHDSSEFLDPTLSEYMRLNTQGFLCNGKRYFVSVRCLICDSPAASYVLRIKQFNGYYGCRKCTVKGNWKSRMVFLSENKPLRTDNSFRRRIQADHHIGTSSFERLSFDMVQQVPLDYMHLVLLGITKLLLTLQINKKTKPSLHLLKLDQLSSNFLAMTPWIPKEFARKPQSLLDLCHWKATTFRLYLLYVGPFIIENVLSEQYAKHFNTLSCAIRILCDPVLYLEWNDHAKQLLVHFVRQFKILYGEKRVTWNMHSLIHLADDARNFGTLDKFSAFPFENEMQNLKRMLRKKNQPLQQVHRRIEERSKLKVNKNEIKDDYIGYSMCQPSRKSLPAGCHSAYRSLKFTSFELKDSRPNNCCITTNNNIFVIESICKKGNETVIIGREFLHFYKFCK